MQLDRETLWNQYSTLSEEAQRQLSDFLDFLANRHPKAKTTYKRPPLEEEPAIGMWADREDMQDSAAWVRSLREKEWTRTYD